MELSFDPDIVNYTSQLIDIAIEKGASDIHLDPRDQNFLTRIRLDGDLVDLSSAPLDYHNEIVARIKIMANLDIGERRLPQDGRISRGLVDLRVSIVPTVRGESVVIRILNNKNMDLRIEDLNFNPRTLTYLKEFTESDTGFLITSGPTSSGKTTSLYSLLKILNKENKSLITIEDPVEYRLDRAKQIQVKEDIGMTFARGLRSILRNDPDIIMVGEIRDTETAKIAVRSSITGHLVLTSLHTNGAFSTLIRLLDMGVEPYLIASSVSLVMSQRLIKKLCPHCSITYELSEKEKSLVESLIGIDFSLTNFRKPQGCEKCVSGYKSRQVLTEIFKMDDEIRTLVKSRADIREFRVLANKKGFEPMVIDGLRRAAKGEVYIKDVLRATYGAEIEDGII